MSASRFWSPDVAALEPYTPGEQPREGGLIKLNTNENPWPPSPAALELLTAELGNSLRLYPDPESQQLRATLAARQGLDPAQVFVGNGSDEVLALAFMAFFAGNGPLAFPDISYSFYPVYARLFGVETRLLPLDADFRIDPEAFALTNIIFPNPNAPTGIALSLDAIEALLRARPEHLVVVDEAYVDFGADSAAALVGKYSNLLVVQTLSKSRSLAGLRVGFAFGQAELIEGLSRVKNSFNSYPLDRVAQALAVAALEDESWFERCRQRVIDAREWTADMLRERDFEVLPSSANFLFVRHRLRDAKTLFDALRREGVLVRHFQRPRIEQWLRISIGSDEQMQALIAALDTIFDGA